MNYLKKNTKVFFLLDKKNNWIENHLRKFIKKFPKKYTYSVSKNPNSINGKIVFVLSYTKILKNNFLKKNKEVLIVHPSQLPKDKGFSPVQNQVLRKKNSIHISLFKASSKVDSGPVAIRDSFRLSGHELSNEIRTKQSLAIFKIIKIFLNKYPKIKYKKQKGKGTYNKKRKEIDNRLNINKSIKSQFNLLRIVDNDLYPAYFEHRNNVYYLRITKRK